MTNNSTTSGGSDPREHARFENADAAFLLGALDVDERRAFEAHLAGCPLCRSRLDALTPVVEALASVTEPDLSALDPADRNSIGLVPVGEDVAGRGSAARGAGEYGPRTPQPQAQPQAAAHADDELMRRLLAEVGRHRRRRRIGVAALGGVAAAAIAALAIVIGTESGGEHAPAVASRSMTALGAGSPVSATAALIGTEWGTEVSLDCRYTAGNYPAGTDAPTTYHLIVTDIGGARHELGSWTLRSGDDARFVSGTALPANDIRSIQITRADGTALLQLRP